MPASAPAPAETELDRETTAFWIEIGNALGFSRSVGETYAFIFLSATPQNADSIVEKTGISRSGVGQALKTLADIGAIRPAAVQSRKEHYELQTDLGILVRLFLNSRVLPRLDELNRRRTALNALAKKSGSAHLATRFDKLERWRGKTKPLVAILRSLASD